MRTIVRLPQLCTQSIVNLLDTISGAVSKQLLVRGEDVQVLHGFTSTTEAEGYLVSDLFNQDVVVELKPYFQAAPEVYIYNVVG